MGEARDRLSAEAAALTRPLAPDVSVSLLYLDLAAHLLAGMMAQLKMAKVEQAQPAIGAAFRLLVDARAAVLAPSPILLATPADVPRAH